MLRCPPCTRRGEVAAAATLQHASAVVQTEATLDQTAGNPRPNRGGPLAHHRASRGASCGPWTPSGNTGEEACHRVVRVEGKGGRALGFRGGAGLLRVAADDPSVGLLAGCAGHAGGVLGLAGLHDVPRRDAVAPPQLPRDAPVADVLEPPAPHVPRTHHRPPPVCMVVKAMHTATMHHHRPPPVTQHAPHMKRGGRGQCWEVGPDQIEQISVLRGNCQVCRCDNSCCLPSTGRGGVDSGADTGSRRAWSVQEGRDPRLQDSGARGGRSWRCRLPDHLRDAAATAR